LQANFSNFADIITVVSGIMTILGVSGFLTWSIFKGKDGLLSEKLLSIFAYSVKSAICISLLPILAMLLYFPWMFFVGFAGGDINATPFSGRAWPIANYVGTTVLALFVVPAYVVICACIFEWSFDPLGRFASSFNNSDQSA